MKNTDNVVHWKDQNIITHLGAILALIVLIFDLIVTFLSVFGKNAEWITAETFLFICFTFLGCVTIIAVGEFLRKCGDFFPQSRLFKRLVFDINTVTEIGAGLFLFACYAYYYAPAVTIEKSATGLAITVIIGIILIFVGFVREELHKGLKEQRENDEFIENLGNATDAIKNRYKRQD